MKYIKIITILSLTWALQGVEPETAFEGHNNYRIFLDQHYRTMLPTHQANLKIMHNHLQQKMFSPVSISDKILNYFFPEKFKAKVTFIQQKILLFTPSIETFIDHQTDPILKRKAQFLLFFLELLLPDETKPTLNLRKAVGNWFSNDPQYDKERAIMFDEAENIITKGTLPKYISNYFQQFKDQASAQLFPIEETMPDFPQPIHGWPHPP